MTSLVSVSVLFSEIVILNSERGGGGAFHPPPIGAWDDVMKKSRKCRCWRISTYLHHNLQETASNKGTGG